ncbi:MAG: hypothetical protein BWY88_01457 [Synergistetes bacterium ADurb.Bin520]|nr:MAG: hypothetical protein BWY88_01457 [Synergistetes bacterium ADurb.Bin520]
MGCDAEEDPVETGQGLEGDLDHPALAIDEVALSAPFGVELGGVELGEPAAEGGEGAPGESASFRVDDGAQLRMEDDVAAGIDDEPGGHFGGGIGKEELLEPREGNIHAPDAQTYIPVVDRKRPDDKGSLGAEILDGGHPPENPLRVGLRTGGFPGMIGFPVEIGGDDAFRVDKGIGDDGIVGVLKIDVLRQAMEAFHHLGHGFCQAAQGEEVMAENGVAFQ